MPEGPRYVFGTAASFSFSPHSNPRNAQSRAAEFPSPNGRCLLRLLHGKRSQKKMKADFDHAVRHFWLILGVIVVVTIVMTVVIYG